jgi:hypothetical protein
MRRILDFGPEGLCAVMRRPLIARLRWEGSSSSSHVDHHQMKGDHLLWKGRLLDRNNLGLVFVRHVE